MPCHVRGALISAAHSLTAAHSWSVTRTRIAGSPDGSEVTPVPTNPLCDESRFASACFAFWTLAGDVRALIYHYDTRIPARAASRACGRQADRRERLCRDPDTEAPQNPPYGNRERHDVAARKQQRDDAPGGIHDRGA
jgi:hypothetical protein